MFNDAGSSEAPNSTTHLPQQAAADFPAMGIAADADGIGTETANSIVRRLLSIRAYAAHVEQWADRERQRAQRQETWLLHRYAGLLDRWLRRELLRRGSRSRSVHLPAGTLSLRRSPPRVEVTDELGLAAWCETHLPAAFRVKIEATGPAAIALKAIADGITIDRITTSAWLDTVKRHVRDHGEVPKGVTWTPGFDRFHLG